MITDGPESLAQPGDLFVLPATSELPVEWAILDRRPGGTAGQRLAVPADTRPLVGGADVEVEAGAPGGPLVLRCGSGVWLDASLFRSDLRSGALSPETVAEALQRWRHAEAGAIEASPLAEEAEADPEYRDWIRDVPERARALAVSARPGEGTAARTRGWSMALPLAAVFAAATLGLSVWVGLLLQEVERLKEPVFDAPSGLVRLGGELRGDSDVEVPAGADHLQLIFVPDPTMAAGEGRLEFLDANGTLIWSSGPVESTAEDFTLQFRREQLPDGEYRVRLYRGTGPEERLVIEETVRIVTER
jgi:hypothetical protein